MASEARTVGDLRNSGFTSLSLRDEMRKNLVSKIRSGEPLFPSILGFEETVIPALQNAILAGQDVIFLGERGQAKSRLMRSMTSLLDEEIPVLDGPEIPEDPLPADLTQRSRAD